jgi:hypothetical protein
MNFLTISLENTKETPRSLSFQESHSVEGSDHKISQRRPRGLIKFILKVSFFIIGLINFVNKIGKVNYL